MKEPKVRQKFTVKAPNYTTEYQFLAPDLVYFDRDHYFAQASSEVDVFGPFWSVALVNVDRGSLAVHRLGEDVPLAGPTTIWIPPYSILDWRLPKGHISWSAFLSTSPPPADLPKAPVAYRGLPEIELCSPAEVFKYLRRLTPFADLGKMEIESTTAIRLKEKIDVNYSNSKSMEELARELHICHPSMTRAFKKTYGITPIAYRNRMRTFEAMRLMLMDGEKAITACFQVGFSDVGRFNKWFRRQMSAMPSQYRKRRQPPARRARVGQIEA